MKKRFWKTPPDLMKSIYDEFGITHDVCPFPKPSDHDALNMDWGKMNFVNPPFRKADGGGFGPTAFVRKAIEENKKGRGSVIIIPTQSYVNLLIEQGAELRSCGRVKWLECDTNEQCKGPSPITMFILRPRADAIKMPLSIFADGKFNRQTASIYEAQTCIEHGSANGFKMVVIDGDFKIINLPSIEYPQE